VKTQASVYDPAKGGINGNPNARPCGVRVADLPWSIAHKTAPCGTVVTITHGDQVPFRFPVADRGPYVAGRDIDMRPDVAAAIGNSGLLDVDYAIGTKRVNLSEFAKAGGNSAAFEKLTGLVANSKGKLAQQTSDQFDAAHSGLAGLSGAANTISDVAGAVSAIVNALFDPSTYFRIGKGLLGGIFVVLGVGGIVFVVSSKVQGSSAVKGVKKVAEVAAIA
jgi:hypothetical protein